MKNSKNKVKTKGERGKYKEKQMQIRLKGKHLKRGENPFSLINGNCNTHHVL